MTASCSSKSRMPRRLLLRGELFDIEIKLHENSFRCLIETHKESYWSIGTLSAARENTITARQTIQQLRVGKGIVYARNFTV